ncbi:MAG: hypothetical protein HY928_07880 [Elusimicrobia bacterium]|nr:hypothetical protein [Elusimicrobiota bacterium]
MPRKLTALLIGYLLAMLPQMVLGTVFGETLGIVRDLTPAPDLVLTAAAALGGLLIVAASGFVMGFSFWAGTAESWKASGVWALAGGLAASILENPRLPASPLLFVLGTAVRGAGAFWGAWWGDRHKDDQRVEAVQGFIFGVIPFPLA